MRKQESFEGFKKRNPCFGGSLLKGNNPKTNRPLDSKLPIHMVLRARKGGMRLPKSFGKVNGIVGDMVKKHGITLYRFSNVGNHLHFVIKLSHVRRWSAFIRELTGRIASEMRKLGITTETHWLHRPFTRVIQSWKDAFQTAKDYVDLNNLEADGSINRKEVKTLKDLRAIFDGGG